MTASKGEAILCNCPRPVGRFRADVDDRASVSPDDFEMDTSLVAPEDHIRWVCPICKAEVARLFGDRWRVITQR